MNRYEYDSDDETGGIEPDHWLDVFGYSLEIEE